MLLIGHFQEEQVVGVELLDVIAVADTAITQNVAVDSETLDDSHRFAHGLLQPLDMNQFFNGLEFRIPSKDYSIFSLSQGSDKGICIR